MADRRRGADPAFLGMGVPPTALLEARRLTYRYPGAGEPALDDVSLRVEEGEFLLLAGPSGGGKSTLLRAFAGLVPDYHGGTVGGAVYAAGQEIGTLPRRERARLVGIVFQDPEKQLVMDAVERELAFGPENLGLPAAEVERRVAEAAAFFGLEDILGARASRLSGGWKQKVALAGVLTLYPRALLLDEPTSQLDPVAAEDFLGLVKRLNVELGLTVVMAEHRLERCYHLASRAVMMSGGRIVADGEPRAVAREAIRAGMSPYLPAVTRLLAPLFPAETPLTVAEGRQLLRRAGLAGRSAHGDTGGSGGARRRSAPAVRLEKVWYRYPGGPTALAGLSWAVHPGRACALVGPNGAGKSTLLRLAAGLIVPDHGRVTFGNGRKPLRETGLRAGVAYLAQNPDDHLFRETVRDELAFTLRQIGRAGDIPATLRECGIEALAGRHPRDLAAGERLRVALASLLVADPEILLLDEPTRGLDAEARRSLMELLWKLCVRGKTVVLASHDIDFVAEWADRVAFLSGGRVLDEGPAREILARSPFFSPQVARLFAGEARPVTLAEARRALAKEAGDGK
ncbi:MAG: ATP-binding cassette domain-containing protein [Thermoanaerobacterales bacterium]|nr:ATP-binding cassette domain-containing protein [Thermoanaerobacterales bacterium]